MESEDHTDWASASYDGEDGRKRTRHGPPHRATAVTGTTE
jgi:hypothetical protein